MKVDKHQEGGATTVTVELQPDLIAVTEFEVGEEVGSDKIYDSVTSTCSLGKTACHFGVGVFNKGYIEVSCNPALGCPNDSTPGWCR